MAVRVYGIFGTRVLHTIAALALLSGAAHAQTVTLPAYEDTTLQGGAYENRNFGNADLVTRASHEDPTWIRHALLKFDTHNTIPAGTTITSAMLTVTVKGGNTEIRTLTAYCVPESFWEHESTWRRRSNTLYWSQPGGTMTHAHATAIASSVPGSTVTFNVTDLVQEALSKSSRYTRLMLVDRGVSSKGSLRSYHSNESASTSLRPALVVTYGSATAPTTPDPTTTTPTTPTPPVTGSSLRVVQWNIASTTDMTTVVDFLLKLQPDLMSLNEVYKYSSDNRPQKMIDLIKARTGQTWYYHWAQISGLSSGVGVAVLSRYPIEGTDTHLLSYNRSAALIRVSVNGRLVHFVSTHLDHQYSSKRLIQVRELKSWLTQFAEQRIVAGDFNWYPGTTEINEMARDYNDAWAVAKTAGTATSAPTNPDGATRNTRIDYVFYSKGATALSLVSAQTTDRIAISDHRAVLAVFKVN
jgi:endonuclease/exonuclease/phosphatase family metal-dependent hydrolase